MRRDFQLYHILLVVAIVHFALAGFDVHLPNDFDQPELIAFGLGWFAAAFLMK